MNPSFPNAAPKNKNSFKKGLGFFPNSISCSVKDPMKELLKTTPTLTGGQDTPEKTGFSSESGSTIPLFDLSQILLTSGQERSRLLQALGIGLTQVGFVAIKAENITPLLSQVNQVMSRYFCQPFERKILDWRTNERMLAFYPRGREVANKGEPADIKESYFIPPNFKDWPKNYPLFARVMSDYYSVLMEYVECLKRYIMEYLGHAERGVDCVENTLRLVYYPSIKSDDEPKALWAAPHVDRSLLTIMSPGTIPGLQMFTNRGHWQPVIVPEGFFIVSTGQLLEYKTAGLIKARSHRVINPGGSYVRKERFSTAFYAFLPENDPMEPFENCVELMTREMSKSKGP